VPLWVGAERLRGRQWLGLLAAFTAVLFALREGFLGSHGLTLRGDLLGLLAGLFWGLTTVVIRATRLTQISAEKLLFYQLAASAVLMPLLSQGLGEVWQWQFSAFAVASLLVQTVLVAFISFLVWMWMLAATRPLRCRSLSSSHRCLRCCSARCG
jgi:drug/metabolite transporter (DMT)-like permease